jgi:molecular chaperone DnaJ
MSKDYYKLLGIERSASQDEVKRGFRKLAHKYHPDKEGGDEAKFKEINEAYQILGDKDKRTQYDQFGSAAFENGGQGGGFGGFSGFGGQGVNFDFGNLGDLGDIFGNVFGGGGSRRQQASRGSDIEVDVVLSFKEMVFGVNKEVNLRKLCTCESCSGSGAKDGNLDRCSSCDGQGVKRVGRRTPLGVIQTTVSCEECEGRGEIPKDRCDTCQGTGVHKADSSIEITVPAGIRDGEVIRARGRGEAAPYGGQSGDLYIRIFVKVDKVITRDDSDLRSTHSIGFTQAALGADVDVVTVDGNVSLTIPAGTQSGDVLRLREKGIDFESKRGDHLVTIQVETPKKLNKKQRKLLEELGHRL